MKSKHIILGFGLFLAACTGKHPQQLTDLQVPHVQSPSDSHPNYTDLLLGEYHTFYEDDEEAIKSLSKALEKDPKSNFIKVHLAYVQAKSENLTEAMKLLEEVLAEEPKYFNALFLYARVLAVKGEFEKSKSVFLRILDLDEISQDPEKKLEVSFVLASLYVEKDEYLRAEELLKQILQDEPEHILSNYYLARVYSERSQLESALKMYEKTVDLDPRFSLAWRAIGLINEYYKRWDRAMEAYSRVIELEPVNIDVRTRMIDIYLQQNQPEKAIAEIKLIKQMYPNIPDVSTRLGLFYYQEKMFPEAEMEFKEAIGKFKDQSDFNYYLGLTQYQLKKFEESQRSFSKVPTTSELYPVSQLAAASLSEELKQPQKSEKILRKALSNQPASVDLRVGLANTLIRAKNLNGAKAVLEEGLVIAPKEGRYMLSLAEVYDKQKLYADQEKTLRTLIRIEPENASALNFLGYSFLDRNVNLGEAEDLILKAVSLRPEDAYIQDSVGWLHFHKKEYDRAEAIFRKALEQIPDEPIILEHLGDTLTKRDKKQEAKNIYMKALENQQDHDRRSSIEEKIQKLAI